ncbi:hypothetical protein AeRB84_009338 [Aphanomyces euteiches]|nr:hypothetical protein AeRB84_009338 [Aphanomyces euteiches]
MATLHRAVVFGHASINTIMHALYGYYYLGFTKKQLAHIYNKHVNTICNWVERFEEDGDYQRRDSTNTRKFTTDQRKWLIEFYKKNPLSFLDEARFEFQQRFNSSNSISSIGRMLRSEGLTWKVLKRRAFHIKSADIIRFALELDNVDWSTSNIQFLDEASFDNRGMLRTRGYCLRGQKLAFRGEFNRKPRVSVLCWIDVNGIVECFPTDGTFDRTTFIACCGLHAQSGKSVRQYPGRGSIWILDGAKIHCHANLVYYLRSIGIIPIFLPAYCPFFNPIEYLFGLMKKAIKRQYVEGAPTDLSPFIIKLMNQFSRFDMRKIFAHCGWGSDGCFDFIRSNCLNESYAQTAQTQDLNALQEFDEHGEPEESIHNNENAA